MTGIDSAIDCAIFKPAPDSASPGSEYPVKPSPMTSRNIVKPMTQLSSRGLRNAPVKKMRPMCVTIAAAKTSAHQWCACRITSPACVSNDSFSTDAYAPVIVRPCSDGIAVPSYTTRASEGWKKNVRYVPLARMNRKQYSATSPSMNDQWSGNAFFSALRRNGTPPSRSSIHVTSERITRAPSSRDR